jgi:hypothetical protein
MASISNQPGGKRTIQFMGLDGKRRSIRLGKTSKAIAETVSAHVQAILNAAEAGIPVDPKTTVWLSEIGDDLHSKLSRVGLVTPRGPAATAPAVITVAEVCRPVPGQAVRSEARQSAGSRPRRSQPEGLLWRCPSIGRRHAR